jgi:EAL and modified HD-GYP domain-containing signal transduction protein
MTSHVLPAPSDEDGVDRTGGLCYLARQPILNSRGGVHAYELLFRSGIENSFGGCNHETASRIVLDDAVVFGLEDLSDSLPAFINCTAEVLTGELVGILPPRLTVLEILETVEPTPALIAACRNFDMQGYRIALDDFLWDAKFAPLVELATYIKVDFLGSTPEERREILRQTHDWGAQLVAEKVETDDDYRQAAREGFSLFQGYYFCRPVVMEKRKIPSNTLFHLEILQELLKEPLDIHRLVPLVKSDASLTYRLLRLVNSAAFGIRSEIRSIQSALVITGDDAFRRLATLAIASEFNAGRPAEILHMALIRARFCELAASLCRLNPTEQYLLGMFSLLPAMLQVSMDEVAPILPLRVQIRESLRGIDLPEHHLLAWLEAHERGDWAASDTIALQDRVNREKLFRSYAEAVRWSASVIGSTV